PETEFIPLLGPLLPTPRAAKKLINLYRLIRLGIPDLELPAFTSAPCQAVLILLAILVGSPNLARELLATINNAASDDDILTVLRKTGPPGTDTAGNDHAWTRIADTIENIRATRPVLGELAQATRWSNQVARYSFHTRDLTNGAPSQP